MGLAARCAGSVGGGGFHSSSHPVVRQTPSEGEPRLLACKLPVGKQKVNAPPGFVWGTFLLQASLLSSESVITGQGGGGASQYTITSLEMFSCLL